MKKTIAIIVAVVLLLFGGTISYAYTVSSISSFDPLGSGTNLSVECGGHSCGTVFFPGGSGCSMNHISCCGVEKTKFTTSYHGIEQGWHYHYEYHDSIDNTYYVCPYGGPSAY